MKAVARGGMKAVAWEERAERTERLSGRNTDASR